MRRNRGWIGAALVALAATILLAWPGGSPASADATEVFLAPFPPDVGVLRLHLGAQDTLTFDPTAPGANTVETLTSSNCIMTSPTQLALTAPGPNASQPKLGFKDDAIGVQFKGEGNGQPCGQVNGTAQTLDLRLAGARASDEMDFAELDVEGKYGVTVRAQLYNGTTLVRTETLPTGGPDSGPDSGDGDNFRWRLPAANAGMVIFNRIVLSVDPSTPTGAFSLEGGADGTAPQPGGLGEQLATSDSLFHLTNVDGTLACGGTATAPPVEGAPTVSVQLVNQTGCEAVPYGLSVSVIDGLQTMTFQKLGGTSNVYRTTIVWPVEPTAYPIPPTQIRYSNQDTAHDLAWCAGTPANPAKPSPDEHWCLLSHSAVLVDGTMQVTEQLWGEGDPGTWR